MKKRIIGMILLILLIVGAVLLLSNNKIAQKDTTNNTLISNNNNNAITWDEITEDGVNEDLLMANIDVDVLTEVATELQSLVEESNEEERINPEILISEGWARVFEYDRMKKVINMGTPAMKPLYLILYKTPFAGKYEYLCAWALWQISGYSFDWNNSEEFMEKFTQKILQEKKKTNAITSDTI